ncbi:hypothetical protein GGR22_000706 [Flavobacterium gossypii]|uniref:DUF600 family protein n=1 Tax=Flavobacterium gossypii TaxID=1646119 RepID=A0ABR6DLM8_9FLAO|nr:hypothetical protein [Flavobacterium gossypii]MBA9072580.1 hypothetical protein [Flavobacterium gossypii]
METKKMEMENLKIEVTEMLLDVITLCEENEIDYCKITLFDVGYEGAASFVFHQEIEFEDIPEELVILSDNISDMIAEEYPLYFDDEKEKFMKQVIDSIM